MEWFEGPLRIAALQCNYEGGRNLAVIESWRRMGFNTEQLMHAMAHGYSSLFDPSRHAAILGRYLARSHRAGIRIILYLNVHTLEPSQSDMRDSWAQRARDGSWPLFYDTYHPCCTTGPWRQHFLGVIDSLARFEVDGAFLDGPAFVAGGCACDACRALFRQRFGVDLEKASERERHAFYTAQYTDFLRVSCARFKAARPRGIFYVNLPVTNPSSSYVCLPDVLACNDFVGTEGGFQFYGPAKEAFLWKPGLRARILEALAPDRPRVIFMAADHKPWSWYPHTQTETRLCIASSAANGASIWWGLHGSTRLLATPGARAAAEMMRFLSRHEERYTRTVSAAWLAVLYSYDTEREYGGAVERSDLYGTAGVPAKMAGSFTRSLSGFCDALARSCLPYDIVTDLDLSSERLERYDCLFLPTCSCLSDRIVGEIRRWVEGGGNLIASFDSSLHDEQGVARADLGLADLLGVRFAGAITSYRDFNYLEFTAAEGRSRGVAGLARLAAKLRAGIEVPLVPAPAFAVEVEPRPEALVVARFRAPMAGRYVDLTPLASPAIVANRFGRGTCLYLAGSLGEMLESFALPEHRKLVANAARALSRQEVALESAQGSPDPINVELCVRRLADRTGGTVARPRGWIVVHLVNHAGAIPRPFEQVRSQTGLRLRVSRGLGVASARALAADRRLRITRAPRGDSLIALPPLGEYEVVVLKTKGRS